ncbi:glycoside hydrolase family 30 beta sandwich domain-containing protein [Kaistella sp. SH11-4b]|nr:MULTISPECIES: glycoside hydrolase family 30 beta sandwich domain-containing protein [unclassified Kaistella]MDP2453868.1 glycoside hydrolase family 30 beta sandwich domain-containing protein [Kaistella sp. SH11-4b]MDP2456925.1 glycoside hydrolase family 30 beta sandwich domain-containing protein [Kaistella sp. SH40-3]MDP2459682.1 glycoside hydrolase family 30 beta sandwich domain-containing protein [Kaistella sp. SH19-2b]
MEFKTSYSFFYKGAALCGVALFSLLSCGNRVGEITTKPIENKVEVWLTKGDESVKLQQQNSLNFTSVANQFQLIVIDDSQKFQTVDGFGYTLTGGSVEVINQLSAPKRKELLEELFGNSANSISVSYLRLSVGASDLDSEVFSYNDLPKGQTDVNLTKFSLARDAQLISILKEILAINPSIKIIAAPWSPPVWMKDNESTIGGSLKPEFYQTYADYFVKYIKGMKKEGITIDAITPQNEPLHPGNNPSLYMTSDMQRDFIKNNLGPTFKKEGISTKIVLYDHNCNKPEYPINILNDPAAKAFIDGSAFHLYEGNISALTTVHNAHPNKNLYFTEQWTGSKGNFHDDINWHTKNVIIGSMRNWSKIALEWNLANDGNFGPHTPGGCTECKGAITINPGDQITRNVAYYIIAHASKFVPANSVRIASTETPTISTAAFLTPQGKTVLIIQNDHSEPENFNIKLKEKQATTSIPGKSVATYVF